MLQRGHGGTARVVVAGGAVVGRGVERQHGGVADGRSRGTADPGQAVVHAIVVVQVVEAHRELVARADAPGVAAGDPFFLDAAAGTVVVGGGAHGVDAQSRVFTGVDVEVAGDTPVLVVAQRQVHLVCVDEPWRLAHLVDRAAGGAPPEQHGRRAAQQLHAVEVEGVAVVESRVAHPVNEHVARALQRKAAQADVFLAALGRQKGDAGGVLQGFLDGVEVAVIDEPLGHHRHRLRDIAQLLSALADGGLGRAHAVLALGGLCLFLHRDGGQGFVRRCAAGLGLYADRSRQHQGAQRQESFVGWWGLQGCAAAALSA